MRVEYRIARKKIFSKRAYLRDSWISVQSDRRCFVVKVVDALCCVLVFYLFNYDDFLFLKQQQSQYRKKLFEASHCLRSMMFGQDRYRRRYWILPQCGGIFVEGMESGEGKKH